MDYKMEKEYQIIGAEKFKNSFRRQVLLCMIASLFYFMTGLCYGYPTVTVPQLRQEANSTEAVSEEMASWISSIVSFSAMPWTCILVITSHYIGRKKPWHFATVITFIAYVILYFSKNITHVFISQTILGITVGEQICISPMVITESASPRYRGLFLSLKSASVYWGIWVANAIGTFFDYRYIGLVGMICALFNFVAIFFIPETPYWLANKGRYDECANAHRMLKGIDKDAEKELQDLIRSQRDNQTGLSKQTILSKCKDYVTLLKQRDLYMPMLLVILITFTYFFSGKLVYAIYAVEMLKKITSSHLWAYHGMLVLDGLSVIGMYLGCILTKHFKRRILLLSTSSIVVILIFSISLYLYLVKLKIIDENNYACIAILGAYSVATCSGPLILCAAIRCEMIPLKARSFSLFFISIVVNLCLGITLKLAPYFFKTFDFHGTFLLFGIGFLTTLICVYKYLPETKDKTLNDIAKMFEKKQSSLPEPASILFLERNKVVD